VSVAGDPVSSDLASLRISREEPPGPSVLRRLLTTLLVLGALGAAGIWLYLKLGPRIFKEQVAVTEVALISPAQSQVLVTSSGYVVPQLWSKVGAKIPGRLSRVLIKEGDTVKAGQVIAALDDADQRSAVAAAQTRVAVARARSNTARANLAEVKPQLERARALVGQGAAGRAEFEDLEARLAALTETVKATDAEATAAQAEVELLKVGLRDRIIEAPIDGTVIAKPAMAGETVGPQMTGVANVAEIADFSSIVIETDVPEARLDLIKVGSPTEIVLDAYPTRRYRGLAVDIGKRVNRAKATVIVKVKFKDTLDGVLPDMSARVSFLREELREDSLKEAPKKVVAAEALTDRDGSKVLFAIDGGKLRMIRVRAGGPVGSAVELLDGPAPGTRVVRTPSSDQFDGQRIKEENP
jgi:RND family efflux transporter MFP subunit